ncbi:MAG: SAM-dependent methyltransferase, partial [Pseudomonadota bacterium]
MWDTTFDRMMTRLILDGELTVTYPDGSRKRYGPGGAIETAVRFTETSTLRRICLNPELGLG